MIAGIVAAILLIVFIIGVYIIYRICFGEFRPKREGEKAEYYMPEGAAYDPYMEVIRTGVQRVIDATDYEVVETKSVDNLTLRGRYYHRKDGAPLVIFFHGYKGNFYRDGNGIYAYSQKHNFNLLLVSQRSQGLSDGKSITFGVMERYDCKSWAEYAVNRFGNEIEIALFGLSMGGATVMMAADVGLPENVKGIMSDCGFSSPKEIICSVMDSIKLPSKLLYPLAKLGAKWFGHFNLEGAAALQSMKNCSLPIVFIHNEGDDFVPFRMSKMCYEACTSKDKKFLEVQGMGHGMSYCLEAQKYEAVMDEFFTKTIGVKL